MAPPPPDEGQLGFQRGESLQGGGQVAAPGRFGSSVATIPAHDPPAARHLSPAVLALANGVIYTGRRVVENAALLVDGGLVTAIVDEDTVPGDAEVVDLGGRSVCPGFVDLQVNGGGDVLFSADLTPEGVRRIRDAHRRFGTTDLLPTFLTGDPDRMRSASAAVGSCIADGMDGILGIHFEGPVISGARAGVHDRRWVQDRPGEEVVAALRGPGRGSTLVTLAPEVAPAGLVADLLGRGARVAAGHTEATFDQAQHAIGAGVDCATHLFNAMRPLTAREPGVVGAYLASPSAWCTVIADGHHVHPVTLALALALRGPGRTLLVSDAMPPVGGTGRSFRLGELEVSVDGGRCLTAEGVLAGSASSLVDGVRTLVERVGIAVDESLRMASTYPARYLGLGDRLGLAEPGYPARLAVLDASFVVSGVVVEGRYQRIA